MNASLPPVVTIREATVHDIPELAALHVRTWRATYEGILSEKQLSGPTVELREKQWRTALETTDGSRFVLVVEDEKGRLVGFAHGRPSDHPEFDGELGSIFLEADYQRKGIGTRLVARIARWFLARGVESMWVFADGRNPSCAFYRTLGGEKLDADPMLGNYGWRDLQRLASRLPEE
jgi:GNAT superfamily N-acetyltransferase